jgi:predicted SprT family Zn-dependent metalloprotease
VEKRFRSMELERRWLHQLHIEYATICRDYRLTLASPIIELSDAARTLGSWCAVSRRLTISRELICNHSWAVVVQVLKHEVAHQLAHESACTAGRPHDEHFQRCCETLGVLPEFRRATLRWDRPEMWCDAFALNKESDHRVEKVRKILALSASTNSHEAAVAMGKAQLLITKYQLEGLEKGDQSEFRSVIIVQKRKRIPRYQHVICRILSDFFFVRCIVLPLYDAPQNEVFRVIELLGTRSNVAIADYCFRFLEGQLSWLWAKYRKEKSETRGTNKNSYYLGVLEGFHQKIIQSARDRGTDEVRQENIAALLVVAERALEKYVDGRYPQLVRRKSGRLFLDKECYRQGIIDGEQLQFRHGLGTTAGKRPVQLIDY